MKVDFCMSSGKAPAQPDDVVVWISDDESNNDVKPDVASLDAKIAAEKSGSQAAPQISALPSSSMALIQFTEPPAALFVCREHVAIEANAKQIRVYNMTEQVYEEVHRYIRSHGLSCEKRNPHIPPNSCIKKSSVYGNNFFAGLPDALQAKIRAGLHMTFKLITNSAHRLLRKSEIGGNANEFDVCFETVKEDRDDIPKYQHRLYKRNPKYEVPNCNGAMGFAFGILTEDYVCVTCFNTSHLSETERLESGLGKYRMFCHPDPKANATSLPQMGKIFKRAWDFSTSRKLTYYTEVHLQHNKIQTEAFDMQIMAGLFLLKERFPDCDDYVYLISKCIIRSCHGPNKRGYEAITQDATFNLHEAAAFARRAYKTGFYCAREDIAVPYALQAGTYSGFFKDNPKAEGTRILVVLIFATSCCMISDGSQTAPPSGQLIAITDAQDARKAKNLMDWANRDNTLTFDDIFTQWYSENSSDLRFYLVCIHPEKLLLQSELWFRLCDVLELNSGKFSGIHHHILTDRGDYKIGRPIVQEIDVSDRDIENDDGGSAAASSSTKDKNKALAKVHLNLAITVDSPSDATQEVKRAKTSSMHPSNGAAASGSGAAASSSVAAASGSGKALSVNVYLISNGAAAAGSGAAAAGSGAVAAGSGSAAAGFGTAANNAVSVAGAASGAASSVCPCKKPNCTMSRLFNDHEDVAKLMINFASNPPKTGAHHQNTTQYWQNRKILVEAFRIRLQHTNQSEKLYNHNDQTHREINGSDGKKMLGDKYKYGHLEHNLRVIWTNFKEFVREHDFLKTEFDKLI